MQTLNHDCYVADARASLLLEVLPAVKADHTKKVTNSDGSTGYEKVSILAARESFLLRIKVGLISVYLYIAITYNKLSSFKFYKCPVLKRFY